MWFHGELTPQATAVRRWIVGWGTLRRMFGDYPVGLVALEAYFSAKPEISAEYVHERLNGILSDDTVRRRLKRMQDMGIVTCRKRGRTLLYRMRPNLAQAAISYIVVQPQVANKKP
jgi:hypothetical protein